MLRTWRPGSLRFRTRAWPSGLRHSDPSSPGRPRLGSTRAHSRFLGYATFVAGNAGVERHAGEADDQLKNAPYYKPPANSPELEYLHERRKQLGGYLPQRRVNEEQLPAPALTVSLPGADQSNGSSP